MKQVILPVPDGRQLRSWLLKGCLILVVAYLAYVVREIWVPLGLALILAMVLDPVVDRMERRGWSRAWASAFIFVSFLIISVGLCILAMPFLTSQVASLQTGFGRYFPNFPDASHKDVVVAFHKMALPEWLQTVGVRSFEGAQTAYHKSSSSVMDSAVRYASNLVWVVIVPIVAFYALRDFHLILAKGLLLVPSKRRESVQLAVVEVTAVFAMYLRGLVKVSLLNGLATFLLLAALRVPNALLLGIVAGLLYTVPYIGAMLTIALTAAVAFIGGGAQLALIAVGSSVVLHQIVFDQIITPRLLGGQVGLHPILSIVALLVGNLLLGIVGMILAVPIAACIQLAVVSLVPKLAQEMDFGAPGTQAAEIIAEVEAESKQVQAELDATHDLHAIVGSTVEEAERKADLDPSG